MATMAAAAVLGNLSVLGVRPTGFRSFGLAAYFFGAVALGALSVGHEYHHRTLATLLAQPVSRKRLMAVKVGVLTAMLVTLAVFAWFAHFGRTGLDRIATPWRMSESAAMAGLAMPMLASLCVAPWLTMACRNPLAGLVFTTALTGMLWLACDIVAVAVGSDRAIQSKVFGWSFLLLSTLGAVSAWRMFIRLELIEGGGAVVHLPRIRPSAVGVAASSPARRHPVWLLVKKELYLQQLTLAVSTLFILGWLTVMVVPRPAQDFQMPLLIAFSFLHAGAIAVLAGSLASAEERQFGTVEWQTLLPMRGSVQWSIKAGVTLALAVVLALGLPALLFYLSPSLHALVLDERWSVGRIALFTGTILFVTTAALYVSSLSTSGVRALTLAVPTTFAGLAAIAFAPVFDRMVFGQWSVVALLGGWPGSRRWQTDAQLFQRTLLIALALALCAAFGVFLLRQASRNHRSAAREAGDVRKQLGAAAGFVAVALTVWATAFAIYRAPVIEYAQERQRLFLERMREQTKSP